MNITDFIRNELEPAIFERLDLVFPDMDFSYNDRRREWSSPKHLDGAQSSDGQGCYVSSKWSNRIADRNGSRNESLSFVDFAAKRMGHSQGVKGAELITVLQSLCSACGLTLPEGEDSQQYKEYREQQERLLAICKRMEKALFTDEGSTTLSYLKEGRGYSEDLIKRMGLGCLTEDTEKELKEAGLLSDINHSGTFYKTSDYYRLAIPYISRNKIRGIKFRSLGDICFPDGKKVSKYKNTNGSGLKEELFGLSGARPDKFREIVIVEGELDTLRAQAEGLLNVVAAAGGDLSPAALKELKRIGADKVTILFDTPERGSEDEKEQPSKIAKALTRIREAGLSGFVASFPEREDGKKVDSDSFLQEHNAEAYRAIVEVATSEILWRYEQAREAAAKTEDSTGEPTEKNFRRLKRETIELANSDYCSPTDRSLLFRYFETDTGEVISAEDIQEEADRLKAETDRRLRENETKSLISKAQQLTESGKTEEALSLLKNRSTAISHIDKEVEYSRYLADKTDSLWEEYKIKPNGLDTGITVKDGRGTPYSLIFPSGAITIIGGATGGGKSKTLQSLAIEAATNGGEGSVLYITYEENEKNVNLQILNSYCDIELTQETAHSDNLRTIREYLYNGNKRYIKNKSFPDFERKLNEYKEIRRDALRIVKPEDNYLETLLGFLSYAVSRKSGVKVKAVFIDYVQELYLEDLKRNTARTDELKEIMVELDLIAQKADIPVIMGAQLVRGVKSPLLLSNDCLADSAWIERKASEILLLWSSLEKPKDDKDGVELKRVQKELPELNIGQGGKLYAKLTKSRFIPKDSYTFLDIDGNTGRVKGDSSQENRQSISSLF